MASMEIGIQYHLPTYAHVPLPHMVELAQQAEAAGVSQLWVTDNLRSRQSFVTLAAMACNVGVKLGTAVTVQYFRNPVDLADSVATLSELMDGRELSIGLGRGNPRTPRWIRTPRPVSVLRETAQSLRRLLDGDGCLLCGLSRPAFLLPLQPRCHLPDGFQPGHSGANVLRQQRSSRHGGRRRDHGRPDLRRTLPGRPAHRTRARVAGHLRRRRPRW